MTKIGSWIIWIVVYIIILAFIIDFPSPVIGLFSAIYFIIYMIFEPILREGIGGTFPSGKEGGTMCLSHEDTIKELLKYYDENWVVEWCIKEYKWKVEMAVKCVSEIAEQEKR